ncbi:MAG TPA: polysaccharide deacetylase family protein [Anaerolineales bacterium]|nr:polysaccharide deacetylase family protein [Anaerolineales bacterium]HNO31158.1 polysaccharide deacetylase family protein [Anaerolineales bacterium]
MRKIAQYLLLSFLLTACSAFTQTVPSPEPSQNPGIRFDRTLVSLTFDDGDADNYLVRLILASNDLHATFYVVSGFTGTDGYMSRQQLGDLYADGNEIGGHTLSHTKLTDVSGADLRREICQDRSNLIGFGFEVTSFAYPYGYFNDETRQVVKDCGYNNARRVSEGPEVDPPADVFALRAMPYIVQDTDSSKMIRYVKEVAKDGGGWAIFVFHHVCSGCDQYSVDLETFSTFADWLGSQQANGLTVKTVHEVIGGDVLPAVAP